MKKLNFWKEFWSTIPLGIFFLAGIVVSVLHDQESQPPAQLGGILLEEMLIKEFGDAYHEYRKHTKKIIPYIYWVGV